MMKSLQQGTVAVLFIRSMLLGFVASLVFMQPSVADEFMNISDIKECRAIVTKAERLLCYDTVADGGVYNQKQLHQVQKEEFESEKMQFNKSIDRVAVTVVRIQKSSNGIHYFHTADGAVWKLVGRGKWSLNVPFQAEIKTGVMGSFFLVTEGGKSARVKRVR